MPRIRSVKPEFWSDEKLAPLDPVTRLVFLGLWSMADDRGRLVDNLKQIDAFIFPETEDSARDALVRLAALGRIRRGVTTSGQRIIQVVNWHHQKIEKPNYAAALPEIADPMGSGPAESQGAAAAPAASRPQPSGEDSPRDRGSVGEASPNHIGILDLGSGSGAGSEPGSEPGSGAGAGAGATAAAAAPAPPSDPLDETHPLPLDGPLGAAPLAPLVRQLRDARYVDATPARWADVLRQLGAVLGAGLLARKKPRWFVRASPDVLARAITQALAEPIEKPHSTIVVVLEKCTSGDAVAPPDAQGHLPAEAAAARDREGRATADREWAMREQTALSWLAHAPPDVRDAIEAELEASAPRGGPSKELRDRALAGLRVHLIERRRTELGELAGVAG